MNWADKPIEEFCLRVTSGGTPSTKRDDFYGGTIPWLRTQEVTFEPIRDTEIKITDAGLRESAAKWIPENSVIVAMYGASAGRMAINKIPLTTNQACCNLVVDHDKSDYRFVYYALRSRIASLESLARGAAQRNLNAGQIRTFCIPAPPHGVQTRIGTVLSAYDELIENNQRRIVLLERAARLLHKEWFVHLRFPGHEHTPLANGLPQGWERRSLEQCVTVVETGSRPKGGVSRFDSGVPSIGAESIVRAGQFDFSKTKYVPEDYFWRLKKGVVQDRDVLVYKDGGRPGHFTPHVSMFGEGFPFDRMALNSHVYRVRGSRGVSQEFLYYHLSSDAIMSWMNKAGSGAAIPGIARKDLLRLPVVVPSPQVVELFTDQTRCILTQILKLALASKKLAEARDLLAPRLISGELMA